MRVEIVNATEAPLQNVQVVHAAGVWTIDRIEPGSQVNGTIFVPLAGLWGRSRECPVSWSFSQKGFRSQPFNLRCELGLLGLRDLVLTASQPNGPAVFAEATMAEPSRVDLGRLVRSTFNPATGPRHFVECRYDSYRRQVIRRIDWTAETRMWAEDVALVAIVVSATPNGLAEGLVALSQVREDWFTPPDPQPLEYRLPFLDLKEAVSNPFTSLEQKPMWP